MTDGLHNLQNAGRTAKKRVGRGTGSGLGTTAGRGTKGQNARSGGGVRPRFEGGHTPIYRLLPKQRGFRSRFTKVTGVNVGELEKHFKSGEQIDRKALIKVGLIHASAEAVKLLGEGEIKKAFKIKVEAASEQAQAKIEAAGGTLVLPQKKA